MLKRLFILSICLALPLSGWSKTQQFDAIDIPIQKFTLSNGLTVIISEDHKAPVVAVNVTYRVGSRNEPEGRRGFAHLFEHLLFQGSENFDDDYFKATQQIGATQLNGTTWFDRTNYFQTVPVNAFDSILWLESDRMGHFEGAISQAKLDEQRKVVLNEMYQGENSPYSGILQQYLSPSLYPQGHPYSWSTIGNRDDLNAATLEDVKQWFKDYYGPNNAILTIVGDVKTKDALTKVKKYFGDIPASKKPFQNHQWVAKRTEARRDIAYDSVPLPRVYKIWNVPGFGNVELDTLDFLKTLLSSGKNSLLYKKLVYEEKIASDVTAYIYPLQLGSVFFIIATAKPGIKLEQVEKSIDEVIAAIQKKAPSKDQFNAIKNSEYVNYITSLEKVGGFSGKANILARYELLTNDPANYKKSFKNFTQTQPKDIQAVAKQWLTQNTSYTLEIHPKPTYKTEKSDVQRKALPLPKEILDVRFPDVQTTKLNNGIVLKHIQRDSIPQLLAEIIIKGGSSLDPKGKEGTMSMMMDLLNEGTKKYDLFEISKKLTSLGSSAYAVTQKMNHGMHMSTLEVNAEKTLEILKQILFHPTFKQSEFDRVKKLTLEYLKKRKAKPEHVASANFYKILFGNNHPLGHKVSGSEESVQKITLGDIKKAYKDTIKPHNVTVYTISTQPIAEVEALFNKALGEWSTSTYTQKKTLPKVGLHQPTIYLIDKPGSVQTYIASGHILERGTAIENIYTSTVFDVLSNQFTSRINMNLREDKGWSYGTYSQVKPYDNQAVYYISGSVQTDRTAQAVSEIFREVSNIKKSQPVTEGELTTLINKKLLTLAGRWETNREIFSYATDQFKNGYPDDFLQQYPEMIKSVELSKVRKATQDVVHPYNLTWVLVGDLEKIEKPLRDLNMASVVVLDDNGNKIR